MKAKLIVEGKEFDIDILDPELQKLMKPPKKTGYERADKCSHYWFIDADGTLNGYDSDEHDEVDDVYYEAANYYSDKTVAENNARAEKLMRQLRRFSVEHRENELDWKNSSHRKYCIRYNHELGSFVVDSWYYIQDFCMIYFDSAKTTELAIETFRDELIWYFTEYKDSI